MQTFKVVHGELSSTVYVRYLLNKGAIMSNLTKCMLNRPHYS